MARPGEIAETPTSSASGLYADTLSPGDLTLTRNSIKTGAEYFAKVLKEHEGSLLLAMGTYNGVGT